MLHRRLDWDSEFFGFPVSTLDPQLSAEGLPDVLAELRHRRVTLVTWLLPSPDPVRRGAALAHGARHVDEKVTFTGRVEAVLAATPADGPPVIRWPGDAGPLRVLALEAGRFSRFRTDPQFPRAGFEALYTRWLERSVAGELARAVFVSGSLSQPTGLVTVGDRGGRAEIGLIAVDAAARGAGVGKALVRAAAALRAPRVESTRPSSTGEGELQVVTQLANVPACRLYERCGLRIASVQPVFHFWLYDVPAR